MKTSKSNTMNFYISPDKQQELEKKLERMFKHLEVKPIVTMSGVQQVVKDVITDYGIEGYSRKRYKINAIYVQIEDIKTQDWVLVATVDYRNGRILMGDSRYFKIIPEQYGLQYTKCDHCGGIHSNRIESHILFNPATMEWMQVGSSCINKMLNGGKYLNGLMVKLQEVIDACGGCGDDEWHGGYWRPSNKYLVEAISFEEAIGVCNDFMIEKNTNIWVKPVYEGSIKVSEGTNSALIDYFCEKRNSNSINIDKNLIDSIKNYFNGIEYGEVDYEKNLNQKIKDAFEDEFITLHDMYLAWFAIMGYKNSIDTAGFENHVKSLGIEKGQEFNFCGELVETFAVEVEDYTYYGGTHIEYDCYFMDDNTGIKFKKQVSSRDVIEKYKQENGKYMFTGTVKYISTRRQFVCFGGRLKKTNVKKSKAA